MRKFLLSIIFIIPLLIQSQAQLGQDIDGETIGDSSGSSVSLSSDGSTVAIGARSNSGTLPRSGHVRIYENQGGSWVQIGADIDGEAIGDNSGSSVSLSSDGSIVAIGAPYNDGNGNNSGHVRIYKNQGGSWAQFGADIDGEATDDLSFSVSLSSDGYTIAVGAVGNDGNGSNSGHVRVYDLSALLSKKSFTLDFFSLYPNPTKKLINIKLNQELDFKKANIYNYLGQFITSTQNLIINTNKLDSGVYFLEVETDKGKSAKKIIIE